MSYTYTDKVKFAYTPNFDAFSRLRVSNPLTMFDSSNRYRDNGLWNTGATGTNSVSFNQNQGLVDLTIGTTSGSEIKRETKKVFSYQPGKSLLVLNTFVMEPAKNNLRQRVGYFGTSNGIYLELDGSTVNLVERSLVTGSPSETRVEQSSWNTDTLLGNGPSGITLDLTKAQILWMDIEWLGVGTVRAGFVIDGEFIVCHKFHHANIIPSTYITTASLPLRYEITNTGITSSSSTLKQVCSSVISEGGYELRGSQLGIGIPINSPRTLGTAGVYYPVISIRLKTSPDRLDAIVIVSALSLLGTSSGNFAWELRASGTTTGGSWVSAGTDSAVEYNLTGASFSSGRVLAGGFFNSSSQNSTSVNVLKESLFVHQLERDTFTSTPYEMTLVVASDSLNDTCVASLDWEEISR